MELRQLRYFVAIVDHGSLSRAALFLHVAQPALTQQLRQLEDELGAQLLHRSAQGVLSTDAGTVFYKHAQAILKQVALYPHPESLFPPVAGKAIHFIPQPGLPRFDCKMFAQSDPITRHLVAYPAPSWAGEILNYHFGASACQTLRRARLPARRTPHLA